MNALTLSRSTRLLKARRREPQTLESAAANAMVAAKSSARAAFVGLLSLVAVDALAAGGSTRSAAYPARARCAAQMRAPDEVHDPYAVLKVARGCTPDEARRAFREAALRVHPDVCDAPDAAAQFIRVKAAFDAVLRRANRATTPDPTGVSDSPRPSPTDPDDLQDMESFVRAMEESWYQARSEARRRWQASEAWKEREFIKHKRAKVKRKAARAASLGASVDGGAATGGRGGAACVRGARKSNWRGGGRIRP